MKFAPIEISDKEVFDKYLSVYNPMASEFTFTNFFMWRKYYNFIYAIDEGLICVIARPSRQAPYALMPFGDVGEDNLAEILGHLKEYFEENGWKLQFKKVEEKSIEYFEAIGIPRRNILHDRDNSDYLYLTDDLINLKGKKFHAKRNHINKLNRMYGYEYVPMDGTFADECLKITEEWCSTRDCNCQRGEYCERYATREILENFDMLGLKGALIKVDGEFRAFTIGEMLNKDTAVIHIEKASFSVDGLYTLINQQFCQNQWAHTTYINREQDLGQEGLRKAKLSYNPVGMVNKYTIC